MTFAAALCLAAALTAAAQQPSKWKAYAPAGEVYSVSLPCTPAVEPDSVTTKDGVKITVKVAGCVAGTVYYMVSTSDFSSLPNGAKVTLDTFRDGVVTGSGTELGPETSVSLGEAPGRAFTSTGSIDGVEVHYTWRVYLVGSRIYTLAAANTAATTPATDADTFISSFKLKK